MNNNIRNYDEQGRCHGKQISYHSNGNISSILKLNHGKFNGYLASFNIDKSIQFKQYWNMDNRIYKEDHGINNQIEIKI